MTENDLRVLDTLETSDYITGELLEVGAFPHLLYRDCS
jgi:hypothetical protein